VSMTTSCGCVCVQCNGSGWAKQGCCWCCSYWNCQTRCIGEQAQIICSDHKIHYFWQWVSRSLTSRLTQ